MRCLRAFRRGRAPRFASFIAYAKANPGKVNMGSGSIGSPQRWRTVQDDDRRRHGSRAVSRYRAGADRLAWRQMQVMFDSPPASIEHIRAGTLRALGVTAATPSKVLPEFCAILCRSSRPALGMAFVAYLPKMVTKQLPAPM
jgi:tripartite-type tricarboxylate transporter receptor subunit TctC